MKGLQFFVHNDSDALRVEPGGSLSGAGVETVHRAWQRATSRETLKPLIVDITFITAADEPGRALLAAMRRSGAQIIAQSPESSAIARPIMDDPIEIAGSKQGWLHRLITFLPRGGAAHRAQADILHLPSAGSRQPSVDYAGPGDTQVPEDAVP